MARTRARGAARRTLATALATALASTVLGGCMGDPSPQPTVRKFLLAWQGERYADAAAATTGDRKRVAGALRRAKQQLDASGIRMKIEAIESDGRSATARFLARMRLDSIGRVWTYEGRLELSRQDGNWRIVWRPSVIHPKLDRGEELAVVTDLPSRASVLDAGGRPLVRATPVVTVGARPDAIRNRKRTLTVLARTTGAQRKQMRSVIESAEPDQFAALATVRRSTYTEIKGRLNGLPGLRTQAGTLPLPLRPGFAQALLGSVNAAGTGSSEEAGDASEDRIRLTGLQLRFRQRLAGTAGSQVVTLEDNGRRAAILARFTGKQSQPVRTTINAGVQRAAEQALRGVGKPAALVAVQASTGRIRAVANRPAGSTYNRAFVGKYRPGSAFKLITTDTLLSNGLQVSSPVPCPDKRLVNGETFTNHRRLSLAGTPTFRTNFAISCTTAFVGLSRELPGQALATSAKRFGLGLDWQLPLPAFTGSVPEPSSNADRAAVTIGQGRVQVSPLSMALVTAAIADGTWRPPTLVTEPRQQKSAQPRKLPDDHVRQLRQLMREAVRSGTADEAALPGLPGKPVHGTTGTAPPGDGDGKPHGWFVGFRGDLAFVVFVQGGGPGGNVAAPIAGDFLAGLPS